MGSEWKNRNRHLYLVFFDVLLLDGMSLLDTCYEERRRCLEGVIKVVPGFVSDLMKDEVKLRSSVKSLSGSRSPCGKVSILLGR